MMTVDESSASTVCNTSCKHCLSVCLSKSLLVINASVARRRRVYVDGRRTALGSHEADAGTGRSVVLGVENTDLCCNVGERPQTVDVTRVDVSSVTSYVTGPASTWLAVDDTVFAHRLYAVSCLPELNLRRIHTSHSRSHNNSIIT